MELSKKVDAITEKEYFEILRDVNRFACIFSDTPRIGVPFPIVHPVGCVTRRFLQLPFRSQSFFLRF
jgi:hypothetical protein